MKIKRIICAIIFVAILGGVLWYVQGKLIPFNSQDTNQTATFYATEKDSVDVLTVGSSSLMVGFSPLRMYEDTGVTSFVRCSSVQAPEVTYLNVKETLKTQHPKVVVVAAITLLMDYDYDEYEAWLRRGMDYKKLSWDKFLVAREIASKSEWQTTASFMFPILRYHSRWKDVLENGISDEFGKYDYMHGQYPVYKSKPIEDVSEEKMADTEERTIYENSAYWYGKLVDLCNENDIEVLFVVAPDMRWTQGKHDAIARTAEEMGVQFLDCNVDNIVEKCELDWSRDFYDDHHVNAPASLKLTDYMADYLVKTYDLKPSEVSDHVKQQFTDDAKAFYKDIEEYESNR